MKETEEPAYPNNGAALFPHLYPNYYKHPWTDSPDHLSETFLRIHPDTYLIAFTIVAVIARLTAN